MITYGSVIKVRKNDELFIGEVIDFLYTINGKLLQPGDDRRKVTARLTVVRREDGSTENVAHHEIAGLVRR